MDAALEEIDTLEKIAKEESKVKLLLWDIKSVCESKEKQ